MAVRRHFARMTLHDHHFAQDARERGDALMFDARGVMMHRICFTGAHDHVALPWREIVHQALSRDCATLLLRHSHPSGDPLPSMADIDETRMICRTLRPLRLRLADHIILAGPRRFSFRENGLL